MKTKFVLITLVAILIGAVAYYNLAKFEPRQTALNIDLCEYGSQDLEQLSSVIEQEMNGKVGFDITKFISTPTDYIAVGKELTSRHHEATGVAVGYRNGARYKCPIDNANINHWAVMFLEDEQKKIYKVETMLGYEGGNFELRNEELDGMKIGGSQNLANAVNDIQRYKSFTREEMRKELLERNFIYHRSCDNDTLKPVESDVYFVKPWPPDSISVLIGMYYSPNPRPNIALYFDKDTQKFVNAMPALGSGIGECGFSRELYVKQWIGWLKINYPNSHYFKK